MLLIYSLSCAPPLSTGSVFFLFSSQDFPIERSGSFQSAKQTQGEVHTHSSLSANKKNSPPFVNLPNNIGRCINVRDILTLGYDTPKLLPAGYLPLLLPKPSRKRGGYIKPKPNKFSSFLCYRKYARIAGLRGGAPLVLLYYIFHYFNHFSGFSCYNFTRKFYKIKEPP